MYLVSACLAGINCKYNGKDNRSEAVCQLVNKGKAIPVCPEQLGGLETPRLCSEIVIDEEGNKKVINNIGEDVTKEFMLGAERTLKIAKAIGIKTAILQPRSPSCGYGFVYDGTFSGVLKEGNGLSAELLIKNGIKVISENDLNK